MKKTILMITVLILTAALLISCTPSAGADTVDSFKMNEPECLGDAGNGKPMFQLTWDKFPDATGYEVAIFAEGTDTFTGEDFAIRSTKGVYSDTPETIIVMLQGVYTDTVRYRIKVQPEVSRDSVISGIPWANTWEINFVDGEYTVSETDEDFDSETAEEKDEPEIEAPVPEIKDPLEHSYPEPLLEYLAREKGEETPFSADDIASFVVGVNHCEYGEPAQTITDSASVDQFKKAVESVKVTGLKDEIMSTETYTYFTACDKDGEPLFYFSIQNGLLEGMNGRYSIEGAAGLFEIDGVRYEDDWDKYWDDLDAKSEEYEDSVSITEGMPVLDAAYMTHLMSEEAPDCVDYITAYIDWNQEVGRLDTSDRAEIESLMKALKKVTVGKEADDPEGQMWHINFAFSGDDQTVESSTYLSMRGKYVEIRDDYYELEGLDDFLKAVDNDMFSYLLNNPEAKKIDPSY